MIVKVPVVEIRTDIRLDVRAASDVISWLRVSTTATTSGLADALEALHVRIHRDRTELPLQGRLDPIHGEVRPGSGNSKRRGSAAPGRLAETGAGVGLIVPQVGTVGLGIVAVDDAQRNMAAKWE